MKAGAGMSKPIKTLISVSVSILGAVLLIDALVLSLVINFNIGLVAVGILGLVLLLSGIVLERIIKWGSRGWRKGFLGLIFIGILGFVMCTSMLAIYGQVDTVTYKEDALIVLGAGIHGETVTMPLKYRLNSAVDYHKKNPEALIVVSGGQGSDELITEALAMERYLVKRGVPKAKILKEEASTSTFENFVFSKRLLTKVLKTDFKVAFTSNDFHLFRAQQIATAAGLNATRKHALIDWYILPVVYVREVLAVAKFVVLGP